MFSIIIYGRNDSHGYNLHKRAATSLNAFAEVMTHPDDEILFVDYNTPDDHPTFPEAIHDTLTDKAKARLRIFRVRPDNHAEFRNKTHLVALEAQSRNVALRRSNPANRWVLYTNSDVLVVPRVREESLSDILAALPDGFYETPRFEIPEMLWEAAFNRMDPLGNLEKLREWAPQFHLNQAVKNVLPMRYDAMGDFQLVLREDMFAIHGFDESMILGWHCDTNLAARLALYRGGPDTLVDRVFAYHCDHTRVEAANNKGRRTRMNSLQRYHWELTTPFIEAQAESWGWPQRDIEELRLDRESAYSRFSAGIAAAMSPAIEPYRTTTLEAYAFRDLTYDLPHSLPFVCDQVLTYPRDTAVMVVASRPEFVLRFAKAWRAMGFFGRVIVPAECDHVVRHFGDAEVSPFAEAVRRADLFIFEFGYASQKIDDPVRTGRQPTIDDVRCLSIVEDLFIKASLSEARTRPEERRTPRRFVGVNVINNILWETFSSAVSANITPFCCQVAAGFARADSYGFLKMLKRRRLFNPRVPYQIERSTAGRRS